VFDVFKSGQLFAYVITVCDESEAEACPIFPGVTSRLHWSFSDPSKFTGTPEDKLKQTRGVRDQIDNQIRRFCAEQPSG
jgi:arsenate reductase